MSIEERIARALEERRIELPEDLRQAEITQLRVALLNLLNASSIVEDWFSSAKMDSAGRRLLSAQQAARAVLSEQDKADTGQ